MDVQFASIVADAAAQYSHSNSASKQALLANFLIKPPLTTVDQLMGLVDKQNAGFSAFREKRHKIFKAMAASMKPIEVVGEIAKHVIEGTPYAPISYVFAAVTYMMKTAENVSKLYDSIEELFLKLKVLATPYFFTGLEDGSSQAASGISTHRSVC